MKIAVAAMGKNVAGHFGHCENFIFFDTADGGITGVNSASCPISWRTTALGWSLPAAWAAARWTSLGSGV